MTTQLIVSVLGPEQEGFIHQLTLKTRALGGRWLANKLTHLDGQMAALLKVEIALDQIEPFKAMVLEQDGYIATFHDVHDNAATVSALVKLTIEGEDRTGLTSDITNLLFQQQIQVDHFESQRYPVIGLPTGVFEANLTLKLPEHLSIDALKAELETLSGRLRVFVLDN